MGLVLKVTKEHERTISYVPVDSKSFWQGWNLRQPNGKKALLEEVEESSINHEADALYMKTKGESAKVEVSGLQDENAELKAKADALQAKIDELEAKAKAAAEAAEKEAKAAEAKAKADAKAAEKK